MARIIAYLSSKHARKERRKSSLAAGAGSGMTNSLGQSLGQNSSVEPHETQSQQLLGATGNANGHSEVNLEATAPEVDGNSGYGATKGFDYEQLKDDQQTS